VRPLGVEMVLVNILHCMVGGVEDVHEFLDWDGPVMSDSGGFQMVSLADNIEILPDGIKFDWDGKQFDMTPAKVVLNQRMKGVDLIMPLDRVVHTLHKNWFKFFESVSVTNRWFRESMRFADDRRYFIVQGGLNFIARYLSLREARLQLAQSNAVGIAIGGLAGGEARPAMYRMVKFCTDRLPQDKPRHLFGVGTPIDLLECIERGIDTFDCVAYTREARHGRIWVSSGYLKLTNSRYKDDQRILEAGCDCPTCVQGATRAELRAGLKSEDSAVRRTAKIQLMLHNIRFVQRLMKNARSAIHRGGFRQFKKDFLCTFKPS